MMLRLPQVPKKVRILVGLGTVSLFTANSFTHFFPKLTRKYFTHTKEIPQDYQSVFQEASNKMMIKQPEKIHLFCANGFSAVSAGSTFLPGGAVLGIPRTFLFYESKDVKNSNLKFKGIPIDWSSSDGVQLEKLLLDSKREHLAFLIAHELAHIRSLDFIPRAVLPTLVFYITYRSGVFMLSLFPTFSLISKLVIIGCVMVVNLKLYFEASKALRYYQEFKADEIAAYCGRQYCEGGIEHMTKSLKINQMLRKMDDSIDSEVFSKDGEKLKDSTHPPRTKRIEKLLEIKSELKDVWISSKKI